MPSMADFNFSGDDPGPSTDPTVDEVDASPMSESTGEEAVDDTNYKEPGQGETFAGNDPTSFDSEGNAEQPNFQQSDVPPIEIEAEAVTNTVDTTNPVERDLDEAQELEEALNLLVNLGLKDYVLSILDDEEILNNQPREYRNLPLKDRIRNVVRSISNSVLDRAIANAEEKIIESYSLESYRDAVRSLQGQNFGRQAEQEARDFLDFMVFRDVGHTENLQAAFSGNIFTHLDRWHRNRAQQKMDDEDQIELGGDEGDIDEMDGSPSPNDSLEYIDINDWLDPLSDPNTDLQYTDLNDALQSVDMHVVDEYIDLNDYMGDTVMESFLEEFMYVSQEEI